MIDAVNGTIEIKWYLLPCDIITCTLYNARYSINMEPGPSGSALLSILPAMRRMVHVAPRWRPHNWFKIWLDFNIWLMYCTLFYTIAWFVVDCKSYFILCAFSDLYTLGQSWALMQHNSTFRVNSLLPPLYYYVLQKHVSRWPIQDKNMNRLFSS